VAHEVFADRTYQPDGTLTSRRLPGALLTTAAEAAQQVVRMVKDGKVRAQDGTDVAIRADTICIHSDGAHALEFARHINQTLQEAEISLHADFKKLAR
jgi:UPF0271 protein